MKGLIWLSCLVLVSAICLAEERIVQIEDSTSVEVQEIQYKDKEGKEEVIVKRTAYGKHEVERELAELQKQLDYWNNIDIEAEKAKIRGNIDKLNLVKAEIDRLIALKEGVK